MDPRQILTTLPSQPEDPPYMSDTANPKVLTITNTAALLEHRLVSTLLDIMENGTERNRLTAVDKTADVLGKKQKQQVLITDSVNLQTNNFLSHFKKQALGAPNDRTRNLPPPDSPDYVDAQYADESDIGDGY